jgi:hypothetical protein
MVGIPGSRSRSSTILGMLGICCSLLGLLAWLEHGGFAMRGINAPFQRTADVAQRMVRRPSNSLAGL